MPVTPHPPPPGDIVTPNFLAVEEALGSVTFPITKGDLLEFVGDGTALLGGRNVDLRTIILGLNDDVFEDEESFREALERRYANASPEEGLENDIGGIDQEDVLRRKDHVTQGPRGLQQWGDGEGGEPRG